VTTGANEFDRQSRQPEVKAILEQVIALKEELQEQQLEEEVREVAEELKQSNSSASAPSAQLEIAMEQRRLEQEATDLAMALSLQAAEEAEQQPPRPVAWSNKPGSRYFRGAGPIRRRPLSLARSRAVMPY